MYLFENTCRIQVDALAGTQELIPVDPRIIDGVAEAARNAAADQGSGLYWPALLRKLDRLDPGYKD